MPLDYLPAQHPHRAQLHNEIHARPPEALAAPVAIAHIVMWADAAQREASRVHLAALLRDQHRAPPDAHSTHLRADLSGFRVRWELHTEFVTWTFSLPLAGDAWRQGAPAPATDAVPRDWLAQLPGQCLCQLQLWVLPTREFDELPQLGALLHEDSLVASSVAHGHGELFTDFCIHADGSSRMLLLAGSMAPRRLGRLVQRLLEIETYRMAALLGLPAARQAAAVLATAERDLAALAHSIRLADRCLHLLQMFLLFLQAGSDRLDRLFQTQHFSSIFLISFRNPMNRPCFRHPFFHLRQFRLLTFQRPDTHFHIIGNFLRKEIPIMPSDRIHRFDLYLAAADRIKGRCRQICFHLRLHLRRQALFIRTFQHKNPVFIPNLPVITAHQRIQ